MRARVVVDAWFLLICPGKAFPERVRQKIWGDKTSLTQPTTFPESSMSGVPTSEVLLVPTMKAIVQNSFGSVDVLEDAVVDVPALLPRDLLVRVKAAGVNPVDTKVRSSASGKASQGPCPVIVGWDVAGVVEEVGSHCVGSFKVGDAVFFAGSIVRRGGNAELVVVDERIVARKPESLSWTEAAAMPLTCITAWEGIFERARVEVNIEVLAKKKVALVIGGAGGAGCIGIQLLKKIASYTVVATASRPETHEFCRSQGVCVCGSQNRSNVPWGT
jgi:NADPH2:quinone reductase